MSKIVTIKLKKAGNRTSTFTISDNLGNVLGTDLPKSTLIKGISYSVDDSVSVITVAQSGENCCNKTLNLPITQLTKQEIVDINFTTSNTSSLWKHLGDNALYNSFYGCTHTYILEYPFTYSFNDEIIQDVKDYTKAYTYLEKTTHEADSNRRIQVDSAYFNKAVLYNDQQSTGTLELVEKPYRNMKLYMSYPKFKDNSKEIIYTKTDNFYQFNTFWNIVKDKTQPLFTSTCVALSFDKEVNDSNMEYSSRSYRKDPIRGKDSKLRLILDNRTDVHLISQVIVEGSQISYK